MQQVMTVTSLFAAPLATVKLNLSAEDKQKLKNFAKKQEYYNTGDSDMNKHFSQKSRNDFVLDDPELSSVKTAFLKMIYSYKNEVFKYNTTHFNMTTSWFTKSKHGQFSKSHDHKNCFISSCYYFGVNEFSNIEFNDPYQREFAFEASEQNEYNSTSLQIKPTDDVMIIFPSNIPHRITTQTAKSVRYSIACNYTPVGSYGINDSQVK